VIFWDSSYFVRAFDGREHGHRQAQSLLTGRGPHAASLLLRTEAISSAARKAGSDASLRDTWLRLMEASLREFTLFSLGDSLMAGADRLVKQHRLRSADAIHLATALFAAHKLGRRGFRFATADREQALAARAAGLRILEPKA
jgi:predicted nucleic acid-binding protein